MVKGRTRTATLIEEAPSETAMVGDCVSLPSRRNVVGPRVSKQLATCVDEARYFESKDGEECVDRMYGV